MRATAFVEPCAQPADAERRLAEHAVVEAIEELESEFQPSPSVVQPGDRRQRICIGPLVLGQLGILGDDDPSPKGPRVFQQSQQPAEGPAEAEEPAEESDVERSGRDKVLKPG